MNKITKLGLVILCIISLTGCGTSNEKDVLTKIKESGVLTMATSPDFPPSEFYCLDANGNKQIVGSDISLGQAIADKLGVKLEIKATDFNGVLANIQSKQVDLAISGFAKTEERKKVMQFSNGYQREDETGYQGLLVKKSNANQFTSLEQIKKSGIKIGAQTGSIQYELAQKLTDEKNIKQLGTTDALVLALNSGDVDAVVVSTTQSQGFLSSFPDLEILPKNEFNLDPDKVYSTNVIGFPIGDQYHSLIEVCNEVINEAIESGNMEKWIIDAKELSVNAIEE